MISKAIENMGFKTDSGEGYVKIKIGNNEFITQILNELKNKDIEYREIDVRRSNLEHVFLNLTGEKLVEEYNQ
jgi:ABC-type multidrug transport system ATPase subunit